MCMFGETAKMKEYIRRVCDKRLAQNIPIYGYITIL